MMFSKTSKTLLLLACLSLPIVVNGQSWHGDTLTVQAFTFQDSSPVGWNAQYKTMVEFPTSGSWSKIMMIQKLKCDSATAGDPYPCGEWDYIWNTLIKVPSADTVEIFSLGSFVTPYGKRLKLGGNDGWEWVYDISEYAPLLKGKRELIAGNNQELLDLKFEFVAGRPVREVLAVQNVYPYGDYTYEHLATDSLLREEIFVLREDAEAFRLKAVISGHGHAGPHNCCEWDSKTHSYYLNKWELYRWNVWKDCGNNPIYPQGGTWPFDRAGWCPGTKVDEYEFEITDKVSPGDSISLDYGIEYFRDNGEKDGYFRMAHQLFSYGPPLSQNDAILVDIISPSDQDAYGRNNPNCGPPEIEIMNGGALPLKTLTVEYGIQGKRKSKYQWIGELQYLESARVSLPPLSPKRLKQDALFEVAIKTSRGIQDENLMNNRQVGNYRSPLSMPSEFIVVIETNNLRRAAENSFMITDGSGLAWYYEDQFHDSTNYRLPISLDKGCYQFVFQDKMEDGISVHWWNRSSAPEQVGINGQVRFENAQGDTLHTFDSDFGESQELFFTVD